MARNLWSDRPLGVKLATLVAAGAVVLAVFAAIAVQALSATGERTDVLLATTAATGSALEADMMHDAVRGDVLSALLAGGGPDHRAAAADLGDHAGTFREVLAAVAAAGLDPAVAAAVAEVTPQVEAYLASADRIVTLAATDPAGARAAYPQFVAAFGTLEEALPAVDDAVAQEAVAVADESAAQRRTAISLSVVVAVAGSWCWARWAGGSPARSSGRCAGWGPSSPAWRTATCAARPV
jgi:hypothetical protein